MIEQAEPQITVWHALPRLIVLFILGCIALPFVIGLAIIGVVAKWVME